MEKFQIILLTWLLTCIAKIPTFMAITIAFTIILLFQINKFKNPDHTQTNEIIFAYLLSSVILSYLLTYNIYPSNLSAILAATVPLIINQERVRLIKRKIALNASYLYKKEKKWTSFFICTFLALFIFGSYLSIKTGLTWDEEIEQQTFLKSIDAISKGLNGDPGYNKINSWSDKYYGIGFYFLTYPIHLPFAELIKNTIGVSIGDAILLSRHIAVFWVFALSTLLVAKITHLLTQSIKYSYLVAIAYFLYPYAFGHGMMNVKDTPFSSAWLLCSYLLIENIKNYFDNKTISRPLAISLALSISLLITIRISGILILAPLFFALILILHDYFNSKNGKIIPAYFADSSPSENNQLLKTISLCIFICAVFVMLLYPVAWQNPYEFIRGIIYMSKVKWDLCTLTNGICMPGQSLPYTYIPEWILVKIPVVMLVGIFFTPYALSKLFLKKDFIRLKYYTLLFAPILVIYCLLIFRNTVLYDELRQVLFSISILFIIGCASLFHLSKRIAAISVIASILIFISDNVKIYPYQLAWFNEYSRFLKINDKYETDYWGVSLSRLADFTNKNPKDLGELKCIYAVPPHLFIPFLDRNKHPCVADISNAIYSEKAQRPFLAAKYARDRRLMPNNCTEIHKESITLTFSSTPIYMGSLSKCE